MDRPMPIPDSFVVKNGSKTSVGSLMPDTVVANLNQELFSLAL